MTDDVGAAGATGSGLSVERLNAWYGESHVLHGVSLDVPGGSVVTLIGRNGAGKTTTLKCIMGMMRRKSGSIRFCGREIAKSQPYEVARHGIAICPDDRGIFASLTVEENLMLPPVIAPGGMSVVDIYAQFQNLAAGRNRQGTKLSGGEQQMLAIARILRTGARFLLLDEPTEGLAPVIVQQIGATIRRLKETGYTILLVEQNFRFAAKFADRHFVVENGRVVDCIERENLKASEARLQAYLGV